MNTPTREELIALCEQAIVPEDKWRDRDSAIAQQNIGHAWALLKAGCPFTTAENMYEDREADRDWTHWVYITFHGFNSFEYEGAHAERVLFYIPTAERLAARPGRDWY